jgi:parallel beta-helix repeat protein
MKKLKQFFFISVMILSLIAFGFFSREYRNAYAAVPDNPNNAANEGITLYNISNFTVSGNQVYDNYEEGIDVKNGTNNGSISNNTVHDNNGPNIYADDANNIKIFNNRVYGAQGATKAGIVCAVESGGNAQDLFIYNNLIYNNKGGGIDCWTGHYSNVQVYNNTIYNNSRGGILSTSGVVTNSFARNNIIYNNGNNTSIGSGFTADHNLFTDPSFVNAAGNDFHLKAGSTAINAGVSDGAPSVDFDGVARPVGGAIDAGAFEYGGTSSGVSPSPSATVAPGSTQLVVSLLLHGLGKAGDSTNPSSSLSATPKHADRTVTVEVLDTQNKLITTKTGTVTYSDSLGGFSGTVNLGTGFTSGSYQIKVKTPQTLKAVVEGIQTISSGNTKTLPVTTLITGDVNGDNALNILDYNIINGCFSDLLPAAACTDANKVLADLNDDGAVNQFDYNLFVREILTQAGK